MSKSKVEMTVTCGNVRVEGMVVKAWKMVFNPHYIGQ